MENKKQARIVGLLVRSGSHSKKQKVQKITVLYITHSNAVCFFRWSEFILVINCGFLDLLPSFTLLFNQLFTYLYTSFSIIHNNNLDVI